MSGHQEEILPTAVGEIDECVSPAHVVLRSTRDA